MAESNSSDNVFSGDMDPEIADLMGIEEEDQPGFNDLFGDGESSQEGEEAEEVDLTRQAFPEITQFTLEKPQPYFQDKNYYQKVLTGEGEVAKRVHSYLASFLKAQDPQDRSLYRNKLIPAYWELLSTIISKGIPNVPEPKALALRYGVLAPHIISPEQRSMFGSVLLENNTGEPVYYVDEWLKRVGSGAANPSATDEVKQAKSNTKQKLNARLENIRGQKEAVKGQVKQRTMEMEGMEEKLTQLAESLKHHTTRPGHEDLRDFYNSGQRDALSHIMDTARNLAKIDREVEKQFDKLNELSEEENKYKDKAGDLGDTAAVDRKTIESEFNTVRQMAKLCTGRQGNHFPIVMKQYLRSSIRDMATRENVIHQMALVEKIDPDVFTRTFKQQKNRIVPYTILIPSYGDMGICWEPFERHNRASSRGRLALPLYPKDLPTSVIAALGDLRWQVAKEKAQHYWMEEGLTGKYYQWFSERRMKGDVRDAFVQDYVLWITKESEGQQKLDRDVRPVFWRFVPFPTEIKDRLKNRGFVYTELYKKDVNRSMSDGY